MIDIRQPQTLLRGGRHSFWDDLDVCPRTTPSQGARNGTYARWFRKPSWAGASPLTLPLTHAAMQRLLRFRTGFHGLPKDIGSQSGAGVPRHQRVCQLCGPGLARHCQLVMRCTWSLSAQRWHTCVASIQIIFRHITTMQQFTWQPNVLQVAKFCDAGMKLLQTVDPNDSVRVKHPISQLAGISRLTQAAQSLVGKRHAARRENTIVLI